MASEKAQIAKEVLALMLGMGMSGPAGVAGRVLGGMGSGPGAKLDTGRDGYPSEFAPDYDHVYDVIYAPRPNGTRGKYQNMNYMGHANADTIEAAGRMQTLKEHEAALTQFMRPGMTPLEEREAMRRGVEAERRLPAFWSESRSRVPFTVSSSAVKGIRLSPDGRIEVQWGGGKKSKDKWYTFKQYPNVQEASLAAQELLKAPSIGRAVYPVVSHPPKKPNPLLGGWNRKNYDESMTV